MTIWISWEVLLFNFECLDISGHQSYTRAKSYCRLNLPSILVFHFECLIFCATESDIRVKIYDHLSSRELPVFIVERPDIWLASHNNPCKKLSSFEFADSFCVQFRLSLYIMRLNRTFEWKVMNMWISHELSLFIVERLNISWASIIHPSQKL